MSRELIAYATSENWTNKSYFLKTLLRVIPPCSGLSLVACSKGASMNRVAKQINKLAANQI